MKIKIIFVFLALLTLSPWSTSALALLAGVLFALTMGNPFSEVTQKITSHLLSLAVVGLGAGMNLKVIMEIGKHGFGYTVIGIAVTLILGTFIGKILKINKNTSLLITVGTAICGGSAIAAVTSVIKAKSEEVSIALGIVFMLNALALFVFPLIGHQLNLSQIQFGLWSALSIHDTSSVVGATTQFGKVALEVGTTLKLARAMWIIPVTFVIGIFYTEKNSKILENKKIRFPWFILGFILVAAVVTYIPTWQSIGHNIEWIAKKLMMLTLFLIGSNLTKSAIKSVGMKPFIQGISLWLIMASGTLAAILFNWIRLI